ncbi:MAG TPA: hypothetical protein VF719_05505, partial [Abditibacteriaceae bacterium]
MVLKAAVDVAAKATSEASDITSVQLLATDAPALKKLDDLSQMVKAAGDAKRLTALDKALTSLDKDEPKGVKQKLEEASSGLQTQIEKPDVPASIKAQLEDRKTAVEAKIKSVGAQHTAVTEAKKKLEEALGSVDDKVKGLLKGIADSASGLPDATADSPRLLKSLSKDMARLEQAQRLRQGVRERWEGKGGFASLPGQLSTAGSSLSDADKEAVSTQLGETDTAVTGKITLLSGWFHTLASDAGTQSEELLKKYKELTETSDAAISSRLTRGRELQMLASSATTGTAQLQNIVDAWPSLLVQIGEIEGAGVENSKTNMAALKTATLNYRATLASAQEWLAGDMTNFKADQVTLYYFGDV